MELRQFRRSVTLATEMCALPYGVARLLWTELKLTVLALLYILAYLTRLPLETVHSEATVRTCSRRHGRYEGAWDELALSPASCAIAICGCRLCECRDSSRIPILC